MLRSLRLGLPRGLRLREDAGPVSDSLTLRVDAAAHAAGAAAGPAWTSFADESSHEASDVVVVHQLLHVDELLDD
jgi:hypothetical protein